MAKYPLPRKKSVFVKKFTLLSGLKKLNYYLISYAFDHYLTNISKKVVQKYFGLAASEKFTPPTLNAKKSNFKGTACLLQRQLNVHCFEHCCFPTREEHKEQRICSRDLSLYQVGIKQRFK